MSPARAATLGVLLLILRLQEGAAGCSNVSALSAQLDSILAEYDRELPPAQPARVRLALDLRHAALRADDTVHLLADFTMTWQDPRIEWNASEWGCDSVLASPDRLWLPAVELLNGAGAARAALSVRVGSDGRLAWVQRLDAAVPVALALRDWPADEQTVVIKFGSRTQYIDELDLEISNIQLAVVFEAGAWEMLSLTGALSAAGEQRVAAWTVQLRRRAGAHRAAAGAVLAAAALLLVAAAATPARTRGPLCACASFTAALCGDHFTSNWEMLSLTGALSAAGEQRVAAWTVQLRRRAGAHRAAAGAVLAAAALLLVAAAATPARARGPLCACASFTAALWLVSATLRVPSGAEAPAALSVMCAVCAGAAAAAAAAALAARVSLLPHQPPRALRTLASTLSRWCHVATSEESHAQAQVGAWAALGALLDRALVAAWLLALFICICVYI